MVMNVTIWKNSFYSTLIDRIVIAMIYLNMTYHQLHDYVYIYIEYRLTRCICWTITIWNSRNSRQQFFFSFISTKVELYVCPTIVGGDTHTKMSRTYGHFLHNADHKSEHLLEVCFTHTTGWVNQEYYICPWSAS